MIISTDISRSAKTLRALLRIAVYNRRAIDPLVLEDAAVAFATAIKAENDRNKALAVVHRHDQ